MIWDANLIHGLTVAKVLAIQSLPINRMKNYYRTVRRAVYEKAEKLGVSCILRDTGSGLHMLARFPEAPSDGYIKETATANGINVKCLSDYMFEPIDGLEKYAVINYSGVTPEQIENIEIKNKAPL